jgi:hypothetical protein
MEGYYLFEFLGEQVYHPLRHDVIAAVPLGGYYGPDVLCPKNRAVCDGEARSSRPIADDFRGALFVFFPHSLRK